MRKILQIFIFHIILAIISFAQNDLINLKHKIKLTDKPIHAVFLPDSKRILVFTEKSTQVWSTETGNLEVDFPKKVDILGLFDDFQVKLQPNGTKFLTFAGDKNPLALFKKKSSAYLWDAATGKLIATLKGEKKSIRDVVWSNDGSRLLTTNAYYLTGQFDEIETYVWTENGELVNRIDRYGLGKFLDNERVVFGVNIWNIKKQQVEKTFDEVDRIADISPDKKMICGYRGIVYTDVHCWRTDGDKSVIFSFPRTKEEGSKIFGGFNQDGSKFAICRTKQNITDIIDSVSGKTIKEFKVGKEFGCATDWSPDDGYLFTLRKGKFLGIWKVENNEFAGEIELVDRHDFLGVVDADMTFIHPIKPIIVANSYTKKIRFFSLETSKLIKNIEETAILSSNKREEAKFFSSDGSMFITRAKEKNTLNIWEIK